MSIAALQRSIRAFEWASIEASSPQLTTLLVDSHVSLVPFLVSYRLDYIVVEVIEINLIFDFMCASNVGVKSVKNDEYISVLVDENSDHGIADGPLLAAGENELASSDVLGHAGVGAVHVYGLAGLEHDVLAKLVLDHLAVGGAFEHPTAHWLLLLTRCVRESTVAPV